MQCLTNDDKDNFITEIVLLEDTLTITKCMDLPSVYEVAKSLPAKVILKSIREIVLNTAKTFKFSENMDLSQATILASDLLRYFKNESIEDIVLMFKMIRRGELGSGKGRLDHDIIFNVFVPAYFDKKAEIRERQIRNEQSKYNQRHEPMSEYAQNKFEELSKMLSINRIEEKVAPVVNHHHIWINKLKNNVKNMSLQQLEVEIEKAKSSDQFIFGEAVKIYQEQINILNKKP